MLLFLANDVTNAGCPFSKTTDEMPCDSNHQHLRKRRLATLSEDNATKAKLAKIISKRKRKVQQGSGCVTHDMYAELRSDLEDMADAIDDDGDRGHFLGGIVRLAAVSPSTSVISVVNKLILILS